jgi:16S rRNA (guanine966-N2)-methyltransferase
MSVRVVAGNLRGRVLSTPSGLSTRPTAARAREAMFSILGDVSGANVLDLYAGSGALGIEALSRGAARAVFVESDRKALACLRDNVERLELAPRARVVGARAEAATSAIGTSGGFTLVLCDPPWAALDRAVALLSRLRSLFASGARVVLEHPARLSPEVPGLAAYDTRRWGDTGATFFECSADPAAEATHTGA